MKFLRTFLPGLLIVFSVIGALAQPFRLAPPQLEPELPMFFTRPLDLKVAFNMAGASIRYTFDGTTPDEHSMLYSTSIHIDHSCTLKLVSFHPDCLPSLPMEHEFIQISDQYEPLGAMIDSTFSPIYPGKGPVTLHDFVAGDTDFHSGKWLGFEGQDLIYKFHLKKARKAHSILVHSMSDPDSWIFPPANIEVWAKKKPGDSLKQIAILAVPTPTKDEQTRAAVLYTLKLPSEAYQYFEIQVHSAGLLPAWHAGKGAPAWLFVDEIVLQ